MKKQNLIALLTTSVNTSEVPNTYKIIINTLTGLVGSSLINHIKYPASVNPSLDERNELDENERGDEANAIRNEDYGIAHAQMPSYKVAQIADGIRHTLYDELHAYGEYEPSESLLRSPAYDVTKRINFNQPMSLEMYMDYRIKMAGQVDEARVRMGAHQLKKPEELIREALRLQAERDKATLIRIKPDVMVEASSLSDVYDVESFEQFDIILQCNFATKLSDKFSQAYARLLPYAIGNLSKASDLAMIEAQHDIIKGWLAANDEELREAMLHRQASQV